MNTARLILGGAWACAAITMVTSAVNAAHAFTALGQPWYVGFALGVAVDIGLGVALLGDRALQTAGRSSGWGRTLRLTTAAMSVGLNCGVPIAEADYGTAAFHAFLPVLLVVLTEAAQAYALAFHDLDADKARAAADQQDRQARQQREVVVALAGVAAVAARVQQPARQVRPAVRQQPAVRASRQPIGRRPRPRQLDRQQLLDRTRTLLADSPDMGRPTLARELGVSGHRAQQVLDEVRAEQQHGGLRAVHD